MTLAEIRKRMEEIRKELEKMDTDGQSISEERVSELSEEIRSLKDEEKQLLEAEEKRQQLLKDLAEGRTGTVIASRSFNGPSGMSGGLHFGGYVTEPGRAGTDTSTDDRFSSEEYRICFMNHVCRGAKIPVEYRTEGTTSTTDVGAVIPTTVLNKIVEKMETRGRILNLVTRTSYKGGVAIPRSTVKPEAEWVEEGKGSNSNKFDMKKNGMVTFTYHKLRCKVAVTLEVETMSLSAFEALLERNIADAMIKKLEQAIISGTGTGQPKGIITEAVSEDMIVSVAEQSYKDLIDAEAAVPAEYEANARWCMNKKTFMGYYGLTDKNGQPVARVNFGIGPKPEYTILGRRAEICEYLPSFTKAAAGGTFAFIFDFEDYVLNTNYKMGIKKYEDNDTDDIVTKSIMLADGKVVEVESLVKLNKIQSA